MEDKVIDAINHVRNKQRVTKERIFNHITKIKTLINQGQHLEAFEYTKNNGVIFSKPEEKRESYFVTNKNSNSWIISNKSPIKVKTVTSPKLASPSTPDEMSVFDNALLTWKKKQPSTTPIPVTPKTLTITQKKFLESIYFRIIFLRKELDNKQWITETLLQQFSENVRPTQQVENTTL